MRGIRKNLLQVFAVLFVSTGVAFFVNGLRHDRLPLVMPFPPTYQCPSSEKPGLPINLPVALGLYGKHGTLFVDARKKEAFLQGHVEGARHIPYSFVEPLSKEILDGLKGYTSVVVYCNREDSEASKLMAGEMTQAGIKNVTYLEKGFAGWGKAGGRYTGEAPEGYDE